MTIDDTFEDSPNTGRDDNIVRKNNRRTIMRCMPSQDFSAEAQLARDIEDDQKVESAEAADLATVYMLTQGQDVMPPYKKFGIRTVSSEYWERRALPPTSA